MTKSGFKPKVAVSKVHTNTLVFLYQSKNYKQRLIYVVTRPGLNEVLCPSNSDPPTPNCTPPKIHLTWEVETQPAVVKSPLSLFYHILDLLLDAKWLNILATQILAFHSFLTRLVLYNLHLNEK